MSEGSGRGTVIAATVVVASILLLIVLGVLALSAILDPIP